MKNALFLQAAACALLASGHYTAQAQAASLPQSPTPTTPIPTPAPPRKVSFPPANPASFTATSPTTDEVNAFLKALWGYDENRVWSVQGILATPAPGVSKVVVYVAEKTAPERTTQTTFFTTPDGKHAIADNVVSFGAKPFADIRETLKSRADGPAQGAKGSDLMLVEFSDLQCSHCRDAEKTMENLATDFPQARIVFQNFPVAQLHPYAMQAAAEGVCVRKAKGDAAFFSYAHAVYNTQEALTKDRADATLAAAAAKAGADPNTVAACAQTQPTKDAVTASIKLGTDIGVTETPMLSINGRLIPLTSVSYDSLKRIVVYEANQDGVPLKLQPSLRTLK